MKKLYILSKQIIFGVIIFSNAPLIADNDVSECFQRREQGVRFGMVYSLNSVDILQTNDPDAKYYVEAIFQNLTKIDPDNRGIVGNIAKSWSINKEKTEFTFNLVKDRLFHNGQILTSKDVAYTFARQCWESRDDLKILGCDKVKKGEYPEGIKVLDQFSIKFVLRSSNPYFIENSFKVSYGIIPENSDPHRDQIGSGLMKVKYFRNGQELCLQKFDGYTGDSPSKIEYISVKLFKTTEEIMNAFKEGKLDMTRIPAASFPEKNLPENMKYVFHKERGTVNLLFDDTQPLFKKLKNRKVLSSIFFEAAKNQKNLYFNEEFSPSYIAKTNLPISYYDRKIHQFSLSECRELSKESKEPLKILLSTSFFIAEFISDLERLLDQCSLKSTIKVITSKDYAEFNEALSKANYDITYHARTSVALMDGVYGNARFPDQGLGFKRFPDPSYRQRLIPILYKENSIELNEDFAKIAREMEEEYDFIPLFNLQSIFIFRNDLIIPIHNNSYFLELTRFSWPMK